MGSSDLEHPAPSDPEPFSGQAASPRRLARIVATAVTAALGVVALGLALALWALGLTGKISQSTSVVLDLVKLGFALVAGVGGTVGLVLAYQRHLIAVEAGHREQAKEAREDTKLFNERFGKAAEQLAAEQYAVKLAGVYAMAKLADDWDEGRQTCINVLCANLRRGYTPKPADDADLADRLAFTDNQEFRHTIIAVIATRLSDPDSRWLGSNFDFRSAVFDGGSFAGAAFSGGTVNFGGATFSGGTVDFIGAQFSSATVDFGGAAFSGGTVRFGGATFSGGTVDFTGATFSGGTVNFRGATFSGGTVDFIGAQFSSGTVDFGGTVNFRGAAFSGATVNFGGATFSGSTVNFRFAAFSDGTVNFRGATFSDGTVDFIGAQFSSATVNFGGATFSGSTVRFGGAAFSGGTVNFGGATLSGGTVDFIGAQFSGGTVNFRGATFSGSTVDFRGVADWSVPPVFSFGAAGVPAGVLLPAGAAGPGASGAAGD